MRGIYKITNKINNHCYVGQSKHIERRFKEHLADYNKKKQYNKTLYRAFRKHGIENFTFEILEEVNNILDLTKKESYYYNFFKAEYNETDPSNCNDNKRQKEVFQYDCNGNFIKKFSSITQAATETNTSRGSIHSNLSGRSKSGKNFIWSYKQEFKNKVIPYTIKKVCFLSKDGSTKKYFNNGKEASIFLNVSNSYVLRVCKGKYKNPKFNLFFVN